MNYQPLVSVIVPVHNASAFLDRCLAGVLASSDPAFELIVVDDASTDDSAVIAARYDARIFQLKTQSGPAAARNYGATQARGPILLFVDADVIVHPETIARLANNFLTRPEIAAAFGSYDDDPADKSFVSQYRNLYHHFTHQQANTDAATFWAGCGAVRRGAFAAVEGFDEERYAEPAIEDIELGYRLRAAGYKILLDKAVQVKHLKRWELVGMIRTDILRRAVPWSNLMFENRRIINDLNLHTSHRISAGLTGFCFALALVSPLAPRLLYFVAAASITILLLNRKLFAFFLEKRGLKFAVAAFPLLLLYYFYSGATFILCRIIFALRSKKPNNRIHREQAVSNNKAI